MIRAKRKDLKLVFHLGTTSITSSNKQPCISTADYLNSVQHV